MRLLAMKIRTFVVFTFLLCGLISTVSATVSANGADAVIKSYISAEEAQNYERVYQLLSVAKKQHFKQDYAVSDGAGYAKLRRSSEARWFNFVEKCRRESKEEIVVTYTVVIEENGEQETVPMTLKLLFQGGEWRIGAIDY